jgi:hypothetical protein
MATMKIIQLKSETIDRLDSVVCDLPKYKKNLDELIGHFTIDKALYLMRDIDRDDEFKQSVYNVLYNKYFDEIEELIHIISGNGR